MRNFTRAVATIINAFLIFAIGTMIYYSINLPDNYFVNENVNLSLQSTFNITAIKSEKIVTSIRSDTGLDSQTVTLKLFGVIPIKDVNVEHVDTPLLIPGGNPFGIKLLADGVMVIGVGDVKCSSGVICPSTNAGIQIGDVIISVNGQKVSSNSEIANYISASNGNNVEIILMRQDEKKIVDLTPVYSQTDQCYRAGMYVRDSTAGIGTLTFYDPENCAFGGLGHPVCDVDTGEIIPLSSGEVVNVNINGVTRGQPGEPGELIGSFSSVFSVGNIQINNKSGLFGTLFTPPNTNNAIPLGMSQDIQIGSATILTTIDGSEPREYSIEIEKIDLNNQDSKNMVIRITDPELLSKTGGIVQGMSGSPIIQDGKLIGAVTHVFVNNPEKGYGIFSDKMYYYSTNIATNVKIYA